MGKEYFESLLSGLNLAYEFTLMGDSELALEVLSKVIDLTRYFSLNREDMIMLGEEFQKVEIFLSILEFRFQKDFQYEIYLEDELKSIFVRRFCFIEPIIKFFRNYIEVEQNKKIIKIYIQKEINRLNMRIEKGTSDLCKDYSYHI